MSSNEVVEETEIQNETQNEVKNEVIESTEKNYFLEAKMDRDNTYSENIPQPKN